MQNCEEVVWQDFKPTTVIQINQQTIQGEHSLKKQPEAHGNTVETLKIHRSGQLIG